MLVSLPRRVLCHAIAYGYLHDPVSRKPLRSLGRVVTAITDQFPIGCECAALPVRLAREVGGIALTVENPALGALLIQPVYQDGDDGGIRGCHVAVQRVTYHPDTDLPDWPGDTVRSQAWLFDWATFGRDASAIVNAAAGLRAEQVMARPRQGQAPRPQPRIQLQLQAFDVGDAAALSATSRAIIAAIRDGRSLRLDSRWCRDEAAFLADLAAALGAIPPVLRGHVSAAAGVTKADAGYQIVWCADDDAPFGPGEWAEANLALDAPLPLAILSAQIFPPGGGAGLPIDPAGLTAQHGLYLATHDDPGFGGAVRLALSALADHAGPATQDAAERAGVAARLRRFACGAPLSPWQAADLAVQVQGMWHAWQPAAHAGEALAQQILELFSPCLAEPAEFAGLSRALDFATLILEGGGPAQLANAIRWQCRRTIDAYLTSQAFAPPHFMQSLLRLHGLADHLAARLAEGDVQLMTAVRCGLAVLVESGEDGERKATDIARRLLPRTSWTVASCRSVEHHEAVLEWAFLTTLSASQPAERDVETTAFLARVLAVRDRTDVLRYALLRMTRLAGASRIAASCAAGDRSAQRLQSIVQEELRGCYQPLRAQTASLTLERFSD